MRARAKTRVVVSRVIGVVIGALSPLASGVADPRATEPGCRGRSVSGARPFAAGWGVASPHGPQTNPRVPAPQPSRAGKQARPRVGVRDQREPGWLEAGRGDAPVLPPNRPDLAPPSLQTPPGILTSEWPWV